MQAKSGERFNRKTTAADRNSDTHTRRVFRQYVRSLAPVITVFGGVLLAANGCNINALKNIQLTD